MTVSEPSSKNSCEPRSYVAQLVERCTENALQEAHRRRQQRLKLQRRIMAAAASIVIIAGIGFSLTTLREQLPATPPEMAAKEDAHALDNYLASISDEEAQLLTDYEVEEFVEY